MLRDILTYNIKLVEYFYWTNILLYRFNVILIIRFRHRCGRHICDHDLFGSTWGNHSYFIPTNWHYNTITFMFTYVSTFYMFCFLEHILAVIASKWYKKSYTSILYFSVYMTIYGISIYLRMHVCTVFRTRSI